MNQIVIDPVTRIEGHAKITINIADDGIVDEARLHVTQFRGFEKFCEGRLYSEMPSLTARTCGICPISHLISASKACDELLAVKIPNSAINIRKILNLAQIFQSHSLNFFHLSSADLVYGMDAPKEQRNIFNLMKTNPDMAKRGIKLRAFGQSIIEKIAGKRIHPSSIIPGGMSHSLDSDIKDEILSNLPEYYDMVNDTYVWFKDNLHRFKDEIAYFGNFDSLFLSIVGDDDNLDFYDGNIKITDSNGNIVAQNLDYRDYSSFIAEHSLDDNYLKAPYYKPLGVDDGMYRVGALARLNNISKIDTPRADKMLEEFKSLSTKAVNSSFYYHYARLIEMMHSIEKIDELLREDETMSSRVKAKADINVLHGIGASEAPRGTLFHDYRVDENGVIKKVNLIIATGNNAFAMNKSITQVAKNFLDKELRDGDLNRVEAVIRAYDPCLSCSTHAMGISGIALEVVENGVKRYIKR
jgi:NAD-reducing hydrogenase large subunit